MVGPVRNVKRWGGCAALLLALLACACATPRGQGDGPTRALLAHAREAGLSLEHPFLIDGVTQAHVRAVLGSHGSAPERFHRVGRELSAPGARRFRYAPRASLTAREADRTREGDCMSFANLAVALTRALGVPSYFVHVRRELQSYEEGGWLFSTSHVAVGYGQGPELRVLDLVDVGPDWSLSLYEPIDDADAIALFYSNKAVEHLVAGRLAEAEKLLRFLLKERPHLKELYSNLAVVLLRSGQREEARTLLDEGLRRYPAYPPLRVNRQAAARNTVVPANRAMP